MLWLLYALCHRCHQLPIPIVLLSLHSNLEGQCRTSSLHDRSDPLPPIGAATCHLFIWFTLPMWAVPSSSCGVAAAYPGSRANSSPHSAIQASESSPDKRSPNGHTSTDYKWRRMTPSVQHLEHWGPMSQSFGIDCRVGLRSFDLIIINPPSSRVFHHPPREETAPSVIIIRILRPLS